MSALQGGGLVAALGGVRAHMRSLWPRAPLLPGAPFALWAGYSVARGERRWDILLVSLVAIVTAYTNPRTQRFFRATLPMLLIAVAYDGQRFLGGIGLSAGRVHTCDLRAFEAAVFGLPIDGARVPVGEWLQARSSLAADVFFAIPYGTFLLVTIVYAVWLYVRHTDRLPRFAWDFFALNIVAYATYRLFPAAPPWYVHTHGCAVDLATRASEASHLTRVDALTGLGYFAGFYGRGRDVFGAVPSLHVAFPLLIVFEGRRFNRPLAKALAAIFFVWMCTAAVYLDHHWVTDIVLGIAYAFAVDAVVCAVLRRGEAGRRGELAVAPVKPPTAPVGLVDRRQ